MNSTFRALTKKERDELTGYVAWTTSLFRAFAFAAAVGLAGTILRGLHRALRNATPILHHDAWWIAPVVLFAIGLYIRAGRWTGGRALRRLIRNDLERGEVALRHVAATDAIEIEEQGDSGPWYFVRTADGKTVLFCGQYLARLKSKGFPWASFDIVEAPTSKVFFGLSRHDGDRLVPSAVRPPLEYAEAKALGAFKANYVEMEADFETLRRGR